MPKTYAAKRQTLNRYYWPSERRVPVITSPLLDDNTFGTFKWPRQVDLPRSIAVISCSAEDSTEISGEQMRQSSNILADPVRSDCLVSARFAPPSSLALRFADKEFDLPIEQLGMPTDRIDWPTVIASPNGEKMMVKGIKGDQVPIDSSVLRYLVDAKYAEEMDAKLKSLQFSEEELETLVRENQPPDEWYESSEQDLRRESWK